MKLKKNASTQLVLCLLLSMPLWATTSGYQVPPKPMADLIDAPRLPSPTLSPDGTMMVMRKRAQLPSIEVVAREEKRLAGMRFNPANRGPSRYEGSESISLITLKDGVEHSFSGIPDRYILRVSFSPDSKYVAFTISTDDEIQLWLANTATRQAQRWSDLALNACVGPDFEWLSDSSAILALTVPKGAGPVPVQSMVPTGPNIHETIGEKAAAPTYQDLLTNPHGEALFEYYMTSNLSLINLDGKTRHLGEPALYTTMDPAPNGSLVMVQSISRPFSYLVPYYRFPSKTEVRDLQGHTVKVIADLPLAENVPRGFGAARTGARNIRWREDADATLVWAEALDGGNPNQEFDLRDKVMMWEAPFSSEPLELARLASRFMNISWQADGKLALMTELWFRSRKMKVWRFDPSNPAGEKTLVFDRSFEDRYNDPGRPLTVYNDKGRRVMATTEEGRLIYSGTGASPEGNIPFVDHRSVDGKDAKRVWHSEAPYYERVVGLLNKAGSLVLTRRESKTEPSNFFVRNLKTGSLRAVTHMAHPTPELAGVTKELITYKRADGVELSGTLYLPAGYKSEDGPLPLLMWAYPREFKSAAAASQVTDSPYEFTNISYWGPLPYLAMGYAVLDGPTMPIIGEGDTQPNDNFRGQLVSSAEAAVDEVVRRGVADRNKIAIGGHSYGAFMVANLLAHSDLFQAGIARSGAYNRTLTPFGFQVEERNFWDAADVYGKMSPFFHAEKINEPILFIHGEADNNSGTFPLQSKRMFNAVKGLGGTARLVMLPEESHGYRARESMLHVLWEQYQWLEEHVKKAEPKPPKNPT